MAMVRQKQNTISMLIDSEGNKLTTYEQISNEAVNFFKNLLGTVDLNVVGCSDEILA